MWIAIGLCAVILVLVDVLMLGLVVAPLFKKQILAVQGSAMELDVYAAAACYALLVGGLYYFIVLPGRPLLDAFFLGVVVYGVYETTTKSILKRWNWQTVAIDTTWGGTLFAITTAGVYAATGRRVQIV